MRIKAVLLSVVSAAISVGFCWLGGMYFTTQDGSAIVLIAALFSLAYGIGSLVLVGMAWWSPTPMIKRVSQWAAAAMVGLWFVGALDSWRISGLELYSIIGIGLVVYVNVAAVSIVCKAQQGA